MPELATREPLDLHIAGLRSEDHGPYDLTVGAGECVLVSGPSGVGKSRFLRMIADLDPAQGVANLGGMARASMPAPAWRRQVCYVAAESGWWAETVREHLSEPQTVLPLLPELGLSPALLDAPVLQLSTGERQRLALLRAVSQQPRFLLLDEPTSALDEATTLLVEALLGRWLALGMGMLIVTHNTAQAQRLGGQQWRLARQGLERVAP